MITKDQMDASLKLNQMSLDNCYIEIGKLIAERDCTEEEAKERIEQKKKLIEYYKGQAAAYEFILLYSPELKLSTNEAKNSRSE